MTDAEAIDKTASVADDIDGSDPLADFGEYRSLRADVWRQFRRHRGAIVGLIVLTIITVAVFIGPYVYPPDPFEINLDDANLTSSATYPFGTDNLGRDVLARSLTGGRISLAVGFAAMVFSLILGVSIGMMAGFYRWLDWPLMAITDLFLSLPLLPLLLVAIVVLRDPLKDALGPNTGIFILVVSIIGLTNWMQTARIVRGEVLAVKEQEFILAARSVGTPSRRILSRHIAANVLSPVTVSASLGVANAIITESALSFLGLGFPTDFPTWGRLLSDGQNYLRINLWRLLVPGILISTTVISVNFIGDGLRDALDPRLRSKS